jgi:hypothetical protein
MDRATATALEKLGKGLAAIAENIAQLQLHVAKLDARVAAIDSQVVAIRKHFDRQLTERADEKIQRDLDLERAVFGQSQSAASKRAGKAESRVAEAQHATVPKRGSQSDLRAVSGCNCGLIGDLSVGTSPVSGRHFHGGVS